MSRSQWSQVVAWSFLIGCCLLAGLITYLQVSKRLSAIRSNANTRQAIAIQDRELELREQIRESEARRLLAYNSPHEDALFLQQLETLLLRSGVKPIRIEAVPLSPLPDIRDVKPEAAQSTESNRPKDAAALSLTHLPLDVQAKSTQIMLTGRFADIRRFLGNVANYSSNRMWINTNSLRLDRMEGETNLRATVVITRFVRSVPDSGAEPK